MKKEDFLAPQAGQVIQTLRGYLTFIPAPLPPDIIYSPQLVLVLSRADAALSELAGLGRQLLNPHLLMTPYIRREAVLSSWIEGTRVGLVDLWLEDVKPGGQEIDQQDLKEVRNYINTLEYGILKEFPLSLRLTREIHAHLLEGVRGEQATPGEFRRSQNWIGPAGSTLTDAPYVPPPPDEMMQALTNWELFTQDRDHYPDLIQCALLHEQFEAIHPFLDGNGRIGRLLITLFLIERERLSQPLLYLSAYIETHRQDYYNLLQRVRTHGDWNSWFIFFLNGVTETAQQASRQARHLMDLREQYHYQLIHKPKAVVLVDQLFINPYMTVSRAAQILAVSNPTARQAIKILEGANIIQEVTGREWGRIYLATDILQAIENP
jgi:Fic family protein